MDLFDVLKKLSEKESDKRTMYLKSFVELSIVAWYSIQTYIWLFKRYGLIDPTSFKDLHEFFISGRLFVCLLLFIFWFLVVRYIPGQIWELINSTIVGVVKLIRTCILWTYKKITKKEVGKVSVFDFLTWWSQKWFLPQRTRDALKFLHTHHPQDELLKNQYHNTSLIIQFSLLFIYSISEKQHLPPWVNIVLWGVVILFTYFQLSMYLVVRFVRKYGYRTYETMDRSMSEEIISVGETSYSPDKPIKGTDQNKLNKRNSYSEILKDSIEKYKEKETLVIGLDGKWGDGKTSFINMTLEDIIKGSDRTKHVLFFNPWNFTNPSELTLHFLNDLKRQLKKVLGHKYSKDLESKFLLYINYVTNGKFETPKDTVYNENDTESLKREINGILERINFKLIVVVDDIDRLTNEETRQMFQFVKLVGDFPNIIYIIPFDKEKVITECGVDEDYLMKIIQIEIKLPPIVHYEVISILNDELIPLLWSLNYRDFDVTKWNSQISGPLGYYIKNLRDVNRVLNTLTFYLSYNPIKELNINDFVYLTVIQIFDSKLYTYLGSNKTTFTTFSHTEFPTLQKKVAEKEDEMLINKKMFKIPKELFKNVVLGLFPHLRIGGFNNGDGERLRREHRINSSQYFDKYFLFPLDEDQLSKIEIEQIISHTSDLDKFKTDLKSLLKNGTLDFFIGRLLDYRFHGSNIRIKRDNLIRGILSIGNDISKLHSEGLRSLKLKDHLQGVVIEFLTLDTELLTEEFIEEIYNNRDNDIDLLFGLYFRIFKMFRVKKDRSFNPGSFVTNSNYKTLNSLHQSLVARLRVSFNQVIVSQRVDKYLIDWKKLDPSMDITTRLKFHLNSNDHFIDFFDKLRHHLIMTELTSPDQIPQMTDYYSIDRIKEFIDFNYFHKRVLSVESSLDNPTKDEHKQEINKKFLENKQIFLDCVSGKIKYPDIEGNFPMMDD